MNKAGLIATIVAATGTALFLCNERGNETNTAIYRGYGMEKDEHQYPAKMLVFDNKPYSERGGVSPLIKAEGNPEDYDLEIGKNYTVTTTSPRFFGNTRIVKIEKAKDLTEKVADDIMKDVEKKKSR